MLHKAHAGAAGRRATRSTPTRSRRCASPDEPDRDYAYEATTDKAVEHGAALRPQRALVSKQVKTYLTPIELPGQLDLVPGDVITG